MPGSDPDDKAPDVARRRGVYPGTFDPPTIAHLAIADAARAQRGLDEVVLTISRVPLGKDATPVPRFADRVEVVHQACASRPWLSVAVTDLQLIADIAHGYDVVVMGADKWAQVNDPAFYDGDLEHMRAAVASLPEVVVAPRPPHPLPAELGLHVPDHVRCVSSTAVREGRRDWMAPAAARFDTRTGAWSDPDRYRRWLRAAGRQQEEHPEES